MMQLRTSSSLQSLSLDANRAVWLVMKQTDDQQEMREKCPTNGNR